MKQDGALNRSLCCGAGAGVHRCDLRFCWDFVYQGGQRYRETGRKNETMGATEIEPGFLLTCLRAAIYKAPGIDRSTELKPSCR
ncbi:hypothetical protein SAMN05421819_2687 [Bryocella elongata]|uniref:Uncharacterized protein n=1 Tax=Bryocella elongata TaxID=863522 RepID=A0A1H5ZIP0_9BACT|nr:hypothetical protein SAMN05421819_2687 [Bryocella elongata]